VVDEKDREQPDEESQHTVPQDEGRAPEEPPEMGGKRATEPPPEPPDEPPPGDAPPPPPGGGTGAPPHGGQDAPPPPPSGGGHGQPFASTGGVQDKDARLWATICHLSALAGLIPIPFLNLAAPVIVWLVKRQEHEFIDEQGKEAVNFQITVTIAGLVLFVLSIVGLFCITVPLGLVLAIVAIIFLIIAALKANEGQRYRYPLSIRLVK
jgi:hypothetical protein